MFTAVIDRPGSGPIELTPQTDSVSFSTVIPGGFGACSFSVPFPQFRPNAIPRLSRVALYHGPRFLWEGRVEDHDLDVVARTLTLSCYGYQRVLEDVSIKRIWLMRAIPWQLVNALTGTGKTFDPGTWAWSTVGRFDDTDLTRSGIRFSAQTGSSASTGDAHGAWYHTDAPLKRILFDHLKSGSDPINVAVYDSPDGTTWTSRYDVAPSNTAKTSANVVLGSTAKFLRMVAYFSSGVGGANVAVDIENIRILGAVDAEDAIGSLYPATILRDLLSQVPDITEGVIQEDLSFGIEQCSRAERDKARSVVEEVTSYFRRYWAVWEDKRLDWQDTALDETQWIVPLSVLSTCRLTTSIDNLVQRAYITYQNVATGDSEEQSSTATDRRNDYVRAGVPKDEILVSPVGMTPNSAAKLAGRISEDHGSLPAVRGTIRLPAFALVQNAIGADLPACYIRAGENILIPELPKDEYMIPGRDGQTLFNVVSTETDLSEEEQTTLSLEGYSRSSDILMARLQAATRVLTG